MTIVTTKVKNDHRSKFSNLSNWKEEAWKNQGFNGIRSPWPPRYRCDALPTELWSHTLGARSINWGQSFREEWNDVKFIWNNSYMNCGCRWKWRMIIAVNLWLHSSVGRASHQYRGGHGFESRWSPDFFSLLLSNCLNWKIYCDDHSSLSSTTAVHIWIISYKLHINSNYSVCKTSPRPKTIKTQIELSLQSIWWPKNRIKNTWIQIKNMIWF